jgi:flagellar capping protein FliD
MTTSIASASTSNTLDSTFVSIINNVITQESQPLTKLTTKQSSIQMQKAIYTDVQTKLKALKTSSLALISTDPFFTLKPGRSVSLSSIYDTSLKTSSTATVATVTPTSKAGIGTYALSNVTLAKSQVLNSAQQTYGDQSLSWTGGFTMGGAAASSAAAVSTNTSVTGFTTGTVNKDQRELGSGPYYIETRQDPNGSADNPTWQFRLVDEDGQAVSIQNGDQNNFSNTWQSIPAADTNGNITKDTGRGLVINFGSPANFATTSMSTGAAKLTYAAAGAHIAVKATDSLADIATKINSATYADGNEVTASVVNKHLILTASRTGVNHQISYADDSGNSILTNLGFTEKQAAKDGQFSLNDMVVNRSRNTGLTDVIGGATLNLAPDAENKTANIIIAADDTAQKTAIQTVLSNFNDLQTYLAAKTGVTKATDGTYTRGALAGDSIFKSLRSDLFGMVMGDSANTGTLKNLSQIGITLDDSLSLTVSDSAALDKALLNDPTNVQTLLDTIMKKVNTKMGSFTGTSGFVEQEIKSADTTNTQLTDQIGKMNDKLTKRRATLTNQYAQMQNELFMLQYTQQTMSAIYGTTSTSG